MPGATPSQPGWYPDQNGTMRWFDGAAWTDHVQPGAGGGVPGSEPAAVQPSTPDPTQRLEQQPGWQGGLPPAGPPSGPPSGPQPGAPGSAYGAVPQPSFPGGPGGPGGPGFPPPPSSGGGNKGLLIILAVVGAIVLVAVLAVGSWAVFVRDDDGDNGSDNGSDNGGRNGSLPDTSPEDVAEQFMDGVIANDCDLLEDLVTERLLEEEGGCEVEDMPTEFTYTVSTAAVDETAETAVVPVVLTFSGGSETSPLTLAMIVDEEEWKVDEIIDVVPTDAPTDATDPSTQSTDVPSESADIDTPTIPELPEIPTDPSELESYFSDLFSEYFTPPTG